MSLAAAREHLEAALALIESEEARQNAPPPAPDSPGRPSAPTVMSAGLANPKAFFDALRASKVLGGTLEESEVNGCNAILDACKGWPVSWTAYALATAVIETNGTMQPVKEAYWLSRAAADAWFLKMYDIQGARPEKARELGNLTPGDGAKYAGRGYVQLTGRRNYDAAEQALGIPLTGSPDLAMVQQHAARIMRWGMETGAFTTKSLNIYLPAVASREQFRNARRVINGLDRADEIAGFAVQSQQALQAGGWTS